MQIEPANNRRVTWLWQGFATIPFVLLAILRWNVVPQNIAGDYAQYILHAKALVEGHPYTSTGYIFSPQAPFVGPRAYPPGLPLTLAPLVAIFGTALGPMKVLMIFSGIVGLGLAFRALSRWVPQPTAALGCAFCGVLLQASQITDSPTTDLGFMVFLWGLVATIDRDKESRWQTPMAFLLGGAAVSYRVVAAAAGPAMILYALVNSGARRRIALTVAAGWAACFGALVLVLPRIGHALEWFASSDAPLFLRIFKHAKHYPQIIQGAFLYPFPGNLANDLYHIVASLLACVGLVVLVRRQPSFRRSFLCAFCVVYGAVLLVSPVKEPRYVWPFYPLMVVFFVEGLVWVLGRVGSAARARLTATGAAVLICLVGTAKTARQPFYGGYEDDPDTQVLWQYLATRHGEPIRLVFENPRVLTMHSGLPAMASANTAVPLVLRELARREITHVVLGQVGPESGNQKQLQRAVADHASNFAEEYRNGRYRVLKIVSYPADTIEAASTSGR